VRALLSALYRDHEHFLKLLDALEHESRVLADGEDPDYDLLELGIDYLDAYAHAVHHPLEERILGRLQQRDPSCAGRLSELERQHQVLERHMRKLHDVFAQVRNDAMARRDALSAAMTTTAGELRDHLVWENAHFFPLAEQQLTDADWLEIEQDTPPTQPDLRFLRLIERLSQPVI
jgi:hemerythrin-like domain-containing protein